MQVDRGDYRETGEVRKSGVVQVDRYRETGDTRKTRETGKSRKSTHTSLFYLVIELNQHIYDSFTHFLVRSYIYTCT